MKRILLLMWLLSALAFGQSNFYADRAMSNNPFGPGFVPLSSAPVRVCTAAATGSPCSPVASITDVFGNPLSVVGGNFGQLTTDVTGRFNFGCSSGNYLIQIAPSGSNQPQTNYYITCGGASGGGGGGGTGCVVNPADGGCAINGSPSVDLFIGGVGSGTGWLVQLLSTQMNVTVPLNVSGLTAGVVSMGCGPDPGLGSNIAITVPASCTPYTLYLPPAASSGYLQFSSIGNKVTAAFENAIDLASTDVTGSLPVLNGGTGSVTASGALINLFPTPIKKGDLIYWDGSNWNNLGGCTVSTCFLTENGGGTPGWAQSPLAVNVGGTGLAAMTVNGIYKGNGTASMVLSSISDSGTTVTITNPIVASGGCTGCGGGGSTTLNAILAAGNTNTIANGTFAQTWQWSPTTNSTMFALAELAAATGGTLGSQYLHSITTLAGSTAVPLNLTSSLTGTQTLPTLHITPTWNTTGVVDAALLLNTTCTASGANSKSFDLQAGGTSAFSVNYAGTNCTTPQLLSAGGLIFSGASGAPTTISTTTANANLILAPNGTGAVVIPTGSATQAGLVFSGDTTSGFARSGANSFGYVNTSNFWAIFNSSTGDLIKNGNGFCITNNANNATSAQLVCLSSPGTSATAQIVVSNLSGGDVASPTAFALIRASGANGGTNVVGSDFVVASGPGTGNALPSRIVLQTPSFLGTTGTTSQTLIDRYRGGQVKTLSNTSGTATSIVASASLATLNMDGGTLFYTIKLGDGTDVCSLTGSVNFALVNKAASLTGAVSSPISETKAQSGSNCGTFSTAWAFSSGVLQVTPTFSTITPTTAYMQYSIVADGDSSLTPQ